MSKLFALLLTSLISSLIARLLIGAGLTFVTYNWVSDLLDELINQVQTSINQLPPIVLSFMKLWTIDLCISMLLSTVQLIIFIKAAKLYLGKK